MALAFGIVYTIQDEEGDTSTTTLHVPTGFSLVDYIDFGRQMADLIDNVIDGLVVSANIGVNVDLTGLSLKTVISVVNDVERKGFFSFLTTLGKRKRVNIPTFDATKVSSGGNSINQADADVAAFLTGMTAGLTVPSLGTMSPSNDVEDDITSVATAEERFRATT